jgi:hypothetical protein
MGSYKMQDCTGKCILQVPFLRSIVTVMSWDATIAPIVYLMVLPVLAMPIKEV